MAVYANGPNLGHGAEGVSILLLTGGNGAVQRVRCTVHARPQHLQHHSISFTFVRDGKCNFYKKVAPAFNMLPQHLILMMHVKGKENTFSGTACDHSQLL